MTHKSLDMKVRKRLLDNSKPLRNRVLNIPDGFQAATVVSVSKSHLSV